MFPLKDNLRTERSPVVTLVLVLLTLLAIVLWDVATLPFLFAAWIFWIAGRSTEDATGRVSFILLVAVLAGLTYLAGEPPLLGVAGGIAGAYLRLYPRGVVQTMVFLPVAASMSEVPASAIVLGWILLVSALALTGLGTGYAVWLPAAAALIGALLLPLTRPRRNPAY